MKTFAEWCKHWPTPKDLARALSVSEVTAKAYRSGKVPTRPKAFEIAEKFPLERESLFMALFGALVERDSEKEILIGVLTEATNQTNPQRRERLLFNLDAVVQAFKREEGTPVRTAIIPLGGWQNEFLSVELVAEFLNVAGEEAEKAGIKRLVAVVAPGQARLLEERKALSSFRKGSNTEVVFATQSGEPRGLGDGILAGADHLHHEPFALIFPDEFPQGPCLEEIVKFFNKQKCSVATLWKHDVSFPSERGIAFCQDKGEFRPISKFLEKPTKREQLRESQKAGTKYFPVLGRYVLTYAVIEQLKRNRVELDSAKKLTLTSSLDEVSRLKGQGVFGYLFEGKVKAIAAPEKNELKKLIVRVLGK